MKLEQMQQFLASPEADAKFTALYGADAVGTQRARYLAALDAFAQRYGDKRDVALYSVPGRSEISGNHTDHNHGCVLAAAVDLDIIAVAAPREDDVVRIKSDGFDEDCIDCASYTEPDASRYFTSGAIIAGMTDAFRERGLQTGGFDAYTTSNVFKGSGLSSSAAFEVMVGNILNFLYNDGTVANADIAKMAQYAENVFFGKPSGLMDQMACAVGGFVFLDFADPTAPIIEPIPFDMARAGYDLCIVNTGGNHADLNDDYASIPAEMKAVAQKLGQPVLRGLTQEDLLAHMAELRAELGDRAVLRACHFFAENARVLEQRAALQAGDLETFFLLVRASGASSFQYLQNVYTTKNTAEQGLSLALCLSEQTLAAAPAPCAWRVHGGGFAGTIQAFVPHAFTETYRTALERVFGEGACSALHIRPDGAIRLFA